MSLYEDDFALWVEAQLKALRAHAQTRPNVDIDWEHVIEEIESVGASERRELSSRLEQILIHLLKLGFSPDSNPRAHWKGEVDGQRRRMQLLLDDSPSLRSRVKDVLTDVYEIATHEAGKDPSIDEDELPSSCPWPQEKIFALGWFPPEPELRQ